MGGIELAGLEPDLQIRLLHDVGGEVVTAQNTQHYAIELGTSRPIEPLERDRVTLGDGREQPCDFNRRRHRGQKLLPAGPAVQACTGGDTFVHRWSSGGRRGTCVRRWLKLICGHQPSTLKALIMAAEAAARRDGYRRKA